MRIFARIAVAEDEVAHLQGQLDAMPRLGRAVFGSRRGRVEPMTSVAPMAMKKRADAVTKRHCQDIVRNAPQTSGQLFLVPKVIG